MTSVDKINKTIDLDIEKLKELSDNLDSISKKTINSFLESNKETIKDLKEISENRDSTNKLKKSNSMSKFPFSILSVMNFLFAKTSSEPLLKIIHYLIMVLDLALIPISQYRANKYSDKTKEYDRYLERIRSNIIRLIKEAPNEEIKNKLQKMLDDIDRKEKQAQNECIAQLLIEATELLNK